MKRGLLVVVMAAGCGAAVVPESGEATSGSSTTGTPATTAMLDSTAPPDPSTSSSETSGTSTEGYELPKLDVAGPDVGPIVTDVCNDGAEIGDVEIVTPSGTFAATHAWWAVYYCCFASPVLVLADAAQLEISEDVILTPNVALVVQGSGKEQESPYLGVYDVGVRDVGSPDFDDVTSGVDMLEPLDTQVEMEPMPSFVATLDVDGRGWSIVGSVSAPFCAAANLGPCICD